MKKKLIEVALPLEALILAIDLVYGEQTQLTYVHQPFIQPLDFHVTSVNCELKQLMALGEEPQ